MGRTGLSLSRSARRGPHAISVTLIRTAAIGAGRRIGGKVGIVAKIENVEWAQWLSGAFKGNFDLTIISHVEPLDIDRYADPAYYWGYDSKAFRDLFKQYNESTETKTRLKLLGDMQKRLFDDQVNAWLYVLPQVSVARKPLKGLWTSSPVFANDMAAVSW